MQVYVCVCVCVLICLRECICLYIYSYVSYVCTYVCTHVCTRVYAFVAMPMATCVSVYLHYSPCHSGFSRNRNFETNGQVSKQDMQHTFEVSYWGLSDKIAAYQYICTLLALVMCIYVYTTGCADEMQAIILGRLCWTHSIRQRSGKSCRDA